MSGRIVLFGATGYTGRLVAAELVERGARPVLAGRDPDRLARLRDELGGDIEVRAADVQQPRGIAELLTPDDVLVTTVGPFVRWGQAAAVAASARGATYLDSTGEGTFIRELHERVGARAAETRAALIPAFGYDYVPGNLAGALALSQAGDAATRVDIGYFAPGTGRVSGGTAASAAGMALMPAYRFCDGRLVPERQGARARRFEVDGRESMTFSIAGSEHLFLPQLVPGLREVGVYLGWFGQLSPVMPAASAIGRGISRLPGATNAVTSIVTRLRGSTGGPDAQSRSRSTSLVVAEASDSSGRTLARVQLTGPNAYTLTGRLLAWAAVQALESGVIGVGVLGPVQAFGLDELTAGCAAIGLSEPGRGHGTARVD